MIRFHLKRLVAEYEQGRGQRLTMGELAAATGIYRTTLSRIAGPRPFNTTTDNLNALCEFFGCSLERLAEYVPDPPTAVAVAKEASGAKTGTRTAVDSKAKPRKTRSP